MRQVKKSICVEFQKCSWVAFKEEVPAPDLLLSSSSGLAVISRWMQPTRVECHVGLFVRVWVCWGFTRRPWVMETSCLCRKNQSVWSFLFTGISKRCGIEQDTEPGVSAWITAHFIIFRLAAGVCLQSVKEAPQTTDTTIYSILWSRIGKRERFFTQWKLIERNMFLFN